jgi:hypothetical protein
MPKPGRVWRSSSGCSRWQVGQHSRPWPRSMAVTPRGGRQSPMRSHLGDRLGRQPLLVQRLARHRNHKQLIDLAAERGDAVAVHPAAETNTGLGDCTLVLGREHDLSGRTRDEVIEPHRWPP